MMPGHWTIWTTGGVHWTAQTPRIPYFLTPGPVGPVGPIGISVWEISRSSSPGAACPDGRDTNLYKRFSCRTIWTVWTILCFQRLMSVSYWTAGPDQWDRPAESAGREGTSTGGRVGGTLSRFISIRGEK